jgi:AraC-like DNA-binding protein
MRFRAAGRIVCADNLLDNSDMRIDVPPASFYRGNAFFRGFGIPLRVIHVEGGPVFPPHRHDFTELVVVYAGAGVHSMAGEERRIGPGEVLLIPRGLEHTYTDTGELSYVNVIFDAGFLLDEPLVEEVSLEPSDRREHAGPPEPFRLSAIGLREALAMVNRMDQELYRKEEGYELAARAAFHLLWVYLARAQSWGEPDEGSSVARVRRLVERVSRNSSQALSVGDMAEEARTSERNFRREFKRVTGEAPVAYVNRLRIEEACALLSSTDKTVTQIAGLVGFEDPAYFTRAFKRVLGMSPKAFRCRE